jgi:hypothetical protein
MKKNYIKLKATLWTMIITITIGLIFISIYYAITNNLFTIQTFFRWGLITFIVCLFTCTVWILTYNGIEERNKKNELC